MARLRPIKTNFTNGELDPLMGARSDLQIFVNGAAQMRNVLAFPQGGFRRRPGLAFVTIIPPVSQVKPLGAVNISIDSGGTSYVVGDDLTLSGGTGTAAKIRVESVSAGVITGAVLIEAGDYTVAPTSPSGATGGAGSGVSFFFDIETQDIVFPVDFTFSVDQNYLILFTVSRFYIFRKEDTGSGDNLLVDQGLHPYSNEELEEITWTQSLDVMLIFHKDHPIFQLTRTGETAWTWDTFLVTNVPSFAFGLRQTVTMNAQVSATFKVGDIKTMVAGGSVFSANDVGSYIRIFGNPDEDGLNNASYYKITAFTSGTTVSAEILVAPIVINSFTVNGGQWLKEEPEWSFSRGYPRCGTFFQGRLCVAGSRERPNTFWASRAGDITDFNNGGSADDLGISITSDTGNVSTFQNIYPGRHLQLYSDSAEFYIPITELEPMTPKTAALRRTTSVGSVPGIPVFEVDGVVYFIQRGGESMRQFVFEDGEKAYSADIVSLFSSHLIRNPRDAAFKKSLSTEDGNFIWLVNGDDGSLAVFSLLRSELINAWSLQTTEGDFHHVAVLDQTTYFHIVRNINGEDVDYIEFFDPDLLFDSGFIVTGLGVGPPATGASGLEHLEGESIGIIVDEILYANQTVVGGIITFEVPATESYQLGLDFPNIIDDDTGEDTGFNALVKTLPVDVVVDSGSTSTMGIKKRVVNCNVRFVDTQGFYLQGIAVPFQQLPAVLDVPIPKVSGDKKLKGLLGWNDFGNITIGQKEPQAMTVLGLAYDVSIGR